MISSIKYEKHVWGGTHYIALLVNGPIANIDTYLLRNHRMQNADSIDFTIVGLASECPSCYLCLCVLLSITCLLSGPRFGISTQPSNGCDLSKFPLRHDDLAGPTRLATGSRPVERITLHWRVYSSGTGQRANTTCYYLTV